MTARKRAWISGWMPSRSPGRASANTRFTCSHTLHGSGVRSDVCHTLMVHSKQGHLVQQHLDELIVERSCLELVDLVQRRCHLSTRAGIGLVVAGKP
jgi:hypothetical protein